MREVIALLGVAFYLVACAALFAMAGPSNWFSAAAAVVLLARAFRHLALSAHLTRSRRWLRLSFARGYQLFCLAYVVAGIVALMGAFISLNRPFSFIVAFGAFCWVWLWGWILGQTRQWTVSES